MFIIDDENYQELAIDAAGDRPLTARPRTTQHGQCMAAKPITEAMPLIPRSKWDELIAAKDANKSWLYDIVKDSVPVMNQGQLGYCHAYCFAAAVMMQRVVEGMGTVVLSAESVGGPVTGWRNEGANPEDDLNQAVSGGFCEASFMDAPWSLRPSRWKAGWEENALNYRVAEFFDLDVPGKVFDACATATLCGIPYGCGFGFWSHAIVGGLKLQKVNGVYSIMHRNSWGADYGDNGFFFMAEGKGTPDLGAFGVRQVQAT